MQLAFQNTLGHIKARSQPEVQEKAAKDVARRLLGNKTAELFVMIVDNYLGPVDKETFKVRNDNNKRENNIFSEKQSDNRHRCFF